jgi:lon-related putative ATP-dependent protease
MTAKNELPPTELRCTCDPAIFTFKDTSEIEPLDEVIGQKRAVEAITFGLNMPSQGYNIFVTGIEGTGKSTIVKDILTKFAHTRPTPTDWCMVNNFEDEYRPCAIEVPAGKALQFSKSMSRLVEWLKIKVPKEFETKSYQDSMGQIQEKFGNQKRDLFEKLNQIAQSKGLLINRTTSGYQTIPLAGDKPMTPEEFANLPRDQQEEIEAKIIAISSEINTTMGEINRINQARHKAVEQLRQEVARFIIQNRMETIREEYAASAHVLTYLAEVQNHMIENIDAFLEAFARKPDQSAEEPFSVPKPSFEVYAVNVLVDRKDEEGAPVIFEPNPTYQNVFGRIEKRAFMGAVVTDFTMVQAGSLLRANGGYLILEIESLLMNPIVWEALKRSLQMKQLFIEDVSVGLGLATASLKPEPIPLEVKVVLVGGYEIFELLQNNDSRFNKIFKVRADFDYETDRSDDAVQQYARFIARVCKEESLLPFTPHGVAAVVEFGEKAIAHKDKLSLRFGPIVGIVKEADYWARQAGARRVTDEHVFKAFNEYRFRYNLYEEKVHEAYTDNTIMIDVQGATIGQVNALAVYQMGDISFGRPSRITAETYMGKHGIVSIEREAHLSGKTHDKGVLTLSGYLGRTFARQYPLSLSISITFEQNYSGIDGDSASSTELYAILSSLADVPIQQGIAVTGSVNQKGQVQAIGGVNQKIEGFFELCKSKGLTGGQGVIIPQANIQNLMLKKEVIDAVKDGNFHVYAVTSIEEGIEILTGLPAGKLDAEEKYPDGTVYGRVQLKLENYYKRSLDLQRQYMQSLVGSHHI